MHSKAILAAGACLVATSLLVLLRHIPVARAAAVQAPAYASNGDMLPVANYREWIYLTSGIDMSYSTQPGRHDHVRQCLRQPRGLSQFCGHRNLARQDRDGARSARGRRARDRSTSVVTFKALTVMGFEVHVKDVARFPGGWAFFDFRFADREWQAVSARPPLLLLPSAAWRGRHHVCAVLSDPAAHRAAIRRR